MVEAHPSMTAVLFFNVQFMFIILYFHAGNAANCRQAEYKVGDECCPACPPGMHVSEHCTEFTSTLCATCEEGTFQGDHNGREQCFGCKNCDTGLGLKEKKLCKATSDALCEPLDGHFCVDPGGGGCLAAQKHRVCSPGQHISQRDMTLWNWN
ncbi:hypothetical protein NHX12_013105 [Muraenolepis orangiensis]|uniref:TNFR-Cys domain-containing protein n=1 Tax=Muraenolepis orangiensis TaxID=630683 RepID=A0A9Q0DDR3_9TELE|nr:hypothetical protein NHX12_013105 [Muraenolepis orangiensis]